jgi:hypothetical protein
MTAFQFRDRHDSQSVVVEGHETAKPWVRLSYETDTTLDLSPDQAREWANAMLAEADVADPPLTKAA